LASNLNLASNLILKKIFFLISHHFINQFYVWYIAVFCEFS